MLDEVEDDPELIELEAEAAMMVDVDDDPIADDEAMGNISPKKAKKKIPSLWPGLDILISTFRKVFMDEQQERLEEEDEPIQDEALTPAHDAGSANIASTANSSSHPPPSPIPQLAGAVESKASESSL